MTQQVRSTCFFRLFPIIGFQSSLNKSSLEDHHISKESYRPMNIAGSAAIATTKIDARISIVNPTIAWRDWLIASQRIAGPQRPAPNDWKSRQPLR
jgi:hypothetical protein